MKKFKILSTILLVLGLAACGGGDSEVDTTETSDATESSEATDVNDTSDSTDSTDTSDSDDIGPDFSTTIPFTCSDVETFDVGGVANTSTSQSGSDGDIIYDCLYDNVSSKFTLEDSDSGSAIPSLNVVDVTKVETADISCSDGSSAKGNITYNYKSGVVNIAATVNGQEMNCESHFTSVLPATLTDHDSIATLLEDWGTDTDRNNGAQSGLTNTNCPQDDGLDDEINPLLSICKGYLQEQYTITDDKGKVHKIAIRSSINK
ncbi:hypothetical protein [uncultured Cocleimonas sp.]|uniref:hypothetical protein n=1 Tax=uncultured Cocleimonas sp. TaxID=1051587 RepID=UPI00261370F2|nr:hypothetical protein [uncultured Cocleimonas sp.]